ncbi:MAG: glycosyltransferase [Candidatus Bathyarchaeia archaeon]
MMELEGSVRPALYLAIELAKKGHTVSIFSPFMTRKVKQYLHMNHIVPRDFGEKFTSVRLGSSILWFEAWAREAFLRLNSKRLGDGFCATVNFSQVVSIPCTVWYLQGPVSTALRDMERQLNLYLRIVYRLGKTVIDKADSRLVHEASKCSAYVIANSRFCAAMYSSLGVNVQEVIYPPIDCKIFHPSTQKPSSEYVLAYLGKETKIPVLHSIASKGVKIIIFGSRIPIFFSPMQQDLARHPNVEYRGRVRTEELVQLYSNALFTVFPFSHEPFGYIPAESMACGTPVLTYGLQGPSESVIDKYSGWFVGSDEEMISKAVQLWKEGYDQNIRKNCIAVASKLDKEIYTRKWLQILDNL